MIIILICLDTFVKCHLRTLYIYALEGNSQSNSNSNRNSTPREESFTILLILILLPERNPLLFYSQRGILY